MNDPIMDRVEGVNALLRTVERFCGRDSATYKWTKQKILNGECYQDVARQIIELIRGSNDCEK